MELRIKDNGAARTLGWNAIYRALGASLPATTVLGKTLYVLLRYNAADTKWDCIDVRVEGEGFIGCRLTKSAVQSIGAAMTAVTFDTEAFDTDAMHDTVTNNSRITFNRPGYYQINGALTTAASVASRVQLRVNGGTVIFEAAVGAAGASLQNGVPFNTVYFFNAGDYLELLGYFGATSNTTSGVGGTFFSAHKVG
jgi:hypothetical protein